MLDRYRLKNNSFSLEEKETIIYDCVKEWLQRDSSERIIEKFRYLFIKGNGCDSPQARSAIEAIIYLEISQQEFNFILNRSCHLIINEWQTSPKLKAKIPLLINQIALANAPNSSQSRTSRKLRELVINFQSSDQYIKLKRLGNLIKNSSNSTSLDQHKPIENLIIRYPYLYQQCLLGEDSSYEFKQTIKRLQKQVQNRYELDLSRYITYRVRLVEIVRKYKADKQTKIPKKIIQPVKNPTFLSDRKLDLGLRQYLGAIENHYTHRSLALSFRDRFPHIHSHQEFKHYLYEYLVLGFDCDYSNEVIKPKLAKYLDSILPDLHANKVDEFTLLRTCSLLLKFLIVDSVHSLNHYFFVDMITHLGEIKVISLLLKIILICDKAKPYLEQRFAILFGYYESFTQDGVQWLIASLEILQLALSLHFGKVDLSFLKIV